MKHLLGLPVYALVTTGRTGSDFLQSLLDSHPQILTFNGHFAVYSEFFSQSLVFNAAGGRAVDAADEFIGKYLYKLVSRYDIQEAKDRLGENSDQSFSIDSVVFRQHLVGLMDGYVLNSKNFLLAIYGAYALCLGQDILKSRILFHHPHLDHELRLFLKDFPGPRLVFSTRDPRANFCSHVEHFRQYYVTHDNQQHLFNCLKMMLEDSTLAVDLGMDYTAIRLEDLPREDVMRKFADWLGVDFSEYMLRSTWAALDWHGDRISKKKFSAVGWSEKRTENGWQNRLGWCEQRVFNYIMHSRLKHYGYAFKPIGVIDSVLVFFLIPLPFKYERRFWSIKRAISVFRQNNKVLTLQLILTPIFYWRRVGLCYKYYFLTLNQRQFDGKWLRVSWP